MILWRMLESVSSSSGESVGSKRTLTSERKIDLGQPLFEAYGVGAADDARVLGEALKGRNWRGTVDDAAKGIGKNAEARQPAQTIRDAGAAPRTSIGRSISLVVVERVLDW